MLINADFSRPVIVTPRNYHWVASPQQGVNRVMLDRVGAEQARATSIVRYAPNSHFPIHQHPGGEEILVLSGTFSADGDDFPAGWYLRNPPGSSHRPYSVEGALIFVKLRQMAASESRALRIDTRDPSNWRRQDGRELCPLFSSQAEQVSLHRLAPAEALFSGPVDSAEVLVIDGSLGADGQCCEAGSWIRLPRGNYAGIAAGSDGVTLYLKTGHLPNENGAA